MKAKVLFFILASALLATLMLGCPNESTESRWTPKPFDAAVLADFNTTFSSTDEAIAETAAGRLGLTGFNFTSRDTYQVGFMLAIGIPIDIEAFIDYALDDTNTTPEPPDPKPTPEQGALLESFMKAGSSKAVKTDYEAVSSYLQASIDQGNSLMERIIAAVS